MVKVKVVIRSYTENCWKSFIVYEFVVYVRLSVGIPAAGHVVVVVLYIYDVVYVYDSLALRDHWLFSCCLRVTLDYDGRRVTQKYASNSQGGTGAHRVLGLLPSRRRA